MVKIALWTTAVWAFAAVGMHGMALACAALGLGHATLVALRSLRRDRLCRVCGRPYGVGRLGMCGACASDSRIVR